MEAITWTGKNAFHSYIIALLIVFAYIIILDRLIALTSFYGTFLNHINAKQSSLIGNVFFVIIFVCMKDIFFMWKQLMSCFGPGFFMHYAMLWVGVFREQQVSGLKQHKVPICEKCFFFVYVVDCKLELAHLLRGVFVHGMMKSEFADNCFHSQANCEFLCSNGSLILLLSSLTKPP